MFRTLASSAGIALLTLAIPDHLLALERQQLPAGITPVSYDLAIVPDETNLRFRGHVAITLDVKSVSPSITLNEDQLALDKAVLDASGAASAISLDEKLQRATLTFEHPIPAGPHTLTIDYHGVIGRETEGFFAMDYDGPAGKRRTIATNFEPTFERRFMPSWDEPGIKATLRLSVDVPADRMAIANMPAASTDPLPNGMKRVHFATTPKMSTYLYFLGIGDFERMTTKSDGTEVAVVVNRGDGKKAALRSTRPRGSCTITTLISAFDFRFRSWILSLLPEQSAEARWKTGARFFTPRAIFYSTPQGQPNATAKSSFSSFPTRWRTSGLAISSPWPGGMTCG